MKALVEQKTEGRSALQRADELGKRVEYLAFMLGPEAYAIAIGGIAEILKPLPITEVPRSDPKIVGVMSVRGRLVTVIDLKRRFNLASTFTMDQKSRILLVDVGGEPIGLLVDEVFQVFRLTDAEIEPPTVLGSEQPPYVVGIGRPPGGAVLMLLDLSPLLQSDLMD
ncbi:MAG: chemotaxis protein CheW [Polyangiaceae bacterium]|nr:chemotaxis protein CheW [Polyangiaceae bacterium]